MDEIIKILECENALKQLIIANVGEDNILTVMALKSVAVVKKPENLTDYKLILLICKGKLVAIAKIKSVEAYNPNIFKRLWGNGNWRSVINFNDIILLGNTLENVFDRDTIKKTQTVSYLSSKDEVDKLIAEVNYSYLFHIKNYLSNIIGIE